MIEVRSELLSEEEGLHTSATVDIESTADVLIKEISTALTTLIDLCVDDEHKHLFSDSETLLGSRIDVLDSIYENSLRFLSELEVENDNVQVNTEISDKEAF